MGSVSGVGGGGFNPYESSGPSQQKQEIQEVIKLLDQLKSAEESGDQLKAQQLIPKLQQALVQVGDDKGMPESAQIEATRAISDIQSGGTLNVDQYLQDFQRIENNM